MDLQALIAEHLQTVQAMQEECLGEISLFAETCRTALAGGNTIYLMGNGGSVCDCQHFAAELVGRFQKERQAMAAVALTTDTSILTALANDYSFDIIYSRQIEALVKTGDGVVNAEIGYLWQPEDCVWVAGAPETIRFFNRKGWPVVVVTNQSGVARGYYREEDVLALHAWMNEELGKLGAHIDAFYYCPHHPKGSLAEYIVDCECRKPKPGMIQKARVEWQAEPESSFLIGDKETDMEAAGAAGIRGYLFTGGNLLEFVEKTVLQYKV